MATNPFSRVFGSFADSAGAIADLGNWSIHGMGLLSPQRVDWLGAPIGFLQSDLVNLTAIVLIAPALLITKLAGSVLAYNVIIFTGLVFPAVMTYAAVRWIGVGALPGIWAGLVTLLLPFHVEAASDWFSVGHITMVPAAIVAVAWWGLSPSWRRALLIGGIVFVAFFTNAYSGLMVLVTALCALAGWALFPGRQIPARKRLVVLARPLLLMLIVITPVVAIGMATRDATSGRPIEWLYAFRVYPWQYGTPSVRSPFYADLLGGPTGLTASSATLFLGFLTVALAIAGLATPRRWAPLPPARANPVLAGATIVAVVGLLLPHTQPFELLGLRITSPGEWIFRVAPAFRAFDRFVMVAAVGMAILGAVALARIAARVPHRRMGVAIPVLAIAFTCAELWIRPVAQSPPIQTPRWAQELEARGAKGPAVVYPLVHPDTSEGYRLRFAQMKIGVPLLNGAPVGSQADRVMLSMPDPQQASTTERLHALGITTIVTTDGAEPAGADLAAKTSDGSVYIVRGQRPPAAAFHAGGYPFEGQAGGISGRWLGGPSAVEVYANRAACVRVSVIALSYGKTRHVRFGTRYGNPIQRVGAAPQNLSVTTRVPPGTTRVGLASTPGTMRVPRAGRRVSLYVAEPVVRELSDAECSQ